MIRKKIPIGWLLGLISIGGMLVIGGVLGLVTLKSFGGAFEQHAARLTLSQTETSIAGIHEFVRTRTDMLRDIAHSPLLLQGVMQQETGLPNAVDHLESSRLAGQRVRLMLFDFEAMPIHDTAAAPRQPPKEILTALLESDSPTLARFSWFPGGKSALWLGASISWRGSTEGVLIAEIPMDRMGFLSARMFSTGHGKLEILQDSKTLFSDSWQAMGKTIGRGLPQLGVQIRYTSDLSQIRREQQELAVNLIFVGSLLVAAIGLITFWVGRRTLVQPLLKIEQMTARIINGESVESASLKSHVVELQSLGRRFDEMARETQLARQHLQSLVEARTQALNKELQDKKTATMELRKVSALQSAILESATYAIVTMDPLGTIMSFNPTAERMFGYRAPDMIGKRSVLVLHRHEDLVKKSETLSRERGQTIASPFDALTFVADRGRVDETECHLVRRGGGTFPARLTITRLGDRDDLVEGYMAVSSDITQRKETEEKLQLAHEIIQKAGEAVVITNPSGQIIDINPAYEKVTGYHRKDILGRNPSMAKSGRHDAAFYADMWTTLNATGRWEGEIWDRRASGEIFPKWLGINAIRDDDGHVSNYVGIFTDISAQKSTERKLERLAFFDPLTKLPNRALFRDRLTQGLEMARRDTHPLALMFIDLDRFKNINDNLGHDVGDEVLIAVAQRIKGCLRKSDTVARLGGDEFTVILRDPGDSVDLGTLADDIIGVLTKPFHIREQDLFIGASIGIALFPEDGADDETLMKNADVAMYQAKQAGRGTYRFFTNEMNDNTGRRIALEADLRTAIDQDQLALHYQPKIALENNRIIGFEALVRWNHPTKGMISPIEFIPLAEETGLIVPLGEWVLKTACTRIKNWRTKLNEDLTIAVNLSARQFEDPLLTEKIEGILTELHLPSSALELEITESIAMADVERTIAVIDGLKSRGLRISIDDFGTGYSSLSYLKRFPLHSLKIDKSFIHGLAIASDDEAIVTAILSMAHSMNLNVIAEGVETEDQLSFLRTNDCEEVQGYFISKPIPAEDVEKML
ncbi:bifunctional diguanylate cyclase/phosphodiesterase [Magnetospira sp. QH-2]|uniref:bifunctional diguanylate cyclase/phosphodiesterase n=1 Tax=Magnetospira sp. (strain QH-2) TaxID=1288970 RepID=UPI0003E80C9B|nr:bifunctional diguanylate cyclase/phosphodiesterase [Magnetospira sp. QH-2]CCQ74199.1 Putative diguanylate kinase [Magnetospira sp. QH-2]